VRQVIAIFLASLVLAACQTDLPLASEPSSPGQAVVSALNYLENDLLEFHETHPSYSFDFSEIYLDRTKLLLPDRADELNNISEKLCLGYRYIEYFSDKDEYSERGDVYLLVNNNDEWIVQEIYYSQQVSTESEQYEKRWSVCLDS